MALDLLIFQFFHQAAERLSFFNFFVVSLAVYLPWAVGFAAFLLIVGEKGRRERLYGLLFTLLVILVSRGIVGEALKFFVGRARPYELLGFEPLFTASGTSFPSGHALFLFALAFAVWRVRREWAGWFFAAAALNALARIASGVHWPSDIVAGALIAWGVYFAMAKLMKPGEPSSVPPMKPV